MFALLAGVRLAPFTFISVFLRPAAPPAFALSVDTIATKFRTPFTGFAATHIPHFGEWFPTPITSFLQIVSRSTKQVAALLLAELHCVPPRMQCRGFCSDLRSVRPHPDTPTHRLFRTVFIGFLELRLRVGGLPEPLLLATNQKVGSSTLSGRATLTHATIEAYAAIPTSLFAAFLGLIGLIGFSS
jgi:hypothetical protein